MWNQREIRPPPACTFKVAVTQELRRKLLDIRGHLQSGKSDLLSHLRLLGSEQYIQDRMIYKLSSQFRSEKSLKHMKQGRVCLNRLKELGLEQQMEELIALFDVDVQEYDVYLPSQQMLQYYLVRLMSTAALLSRTCQLLQDTYFSAKQLMEIGNMLSQNLMLISISARLWVTCRSLRTCVCTWYQALFPLLSHLQATPVCWLKSESGGEEILPASLPEWLQSLFRWEMFEEEKSMLEQAGKLKFTDDSEEENHISDIEIKALGLAAEDIGEPVIRKENIIKKDEKIYDYIPPSKAGKGKNIIGKSEENNKNDHDEYTVVTKNIPLAETELSNTDQNGRKRVKKHLQKKLKNLTRVFKFLKIIQRQNPFQLGCYEFETTPELRLTFKDMLSSCKNFMRENAKESDNAKKVKLKNKFTAKFQKLLIGSLLKLKRKYQPTMSQQKTVKVPFKERVQIVDLCNEDIYSTATDVMKDDKISDFGECAQEEIYSKNMTESSSCVKEETGNKVRSKFKRKLNTNANKYNKKTKYLNNAIESIDILGKDLDYLAQHKSPQNDKSKCLPESYDKKVNVTEKKLKGKKKKGSKSVASKSLPEAKMKRHLIENIDGKKSKKKRGN